MKSPDFTLSPARVTLFAASPFFFETDTRMKSFSSV